MDQSDDDRSPWEREEPYAMLGMDDFDPEEEELGPPDEEDMGNPQEDEQLGGSLPLLTQQVQRMAVLVQFRFNPQFSP